MMPVLAALLVCLFILVKGSIPALLLILLLILILFSPGLLFVFALFGPPLLERAWEAVKGFIKHLFRPPDR